jgi:hypothetical protein
VLRGPDGRPQAGAWAVLHRVQMRGASGPIDSVRTGPTGAYALVLTRPDTNAMYVVSSWYRGIAYFSERVPVARRKSASLQPILVYDTTSGGPPIHLQRRLITIARPDKDGTRAVLELLALENRGTATRIAADTARPTWSGAVPREGIQFEAGQGDISADAIGLRGDSVLVFGPIPPQSPKQVSFSYVLPATLRQLAIPIDQPTGELDLLFEDTTTVVTAPGIESLGVQAIEQRRFAGYRAGSLAPAAVVTVTFPPRGFQIQSLVPWVIALAILVLVAGLVLALRRKPSLAPPSLPG